MPPWGLVSCDEHFWQFFDISLRNSLDSLTCHQVRSECCWQVCESGNDEGWLEWWDWPATLHRLCDTNTEAHRDFCCFICNRTLTPAEVLIITPYNKMFHSHQRNFLPSSTTIAKFPSGDRPTHVMFFVVETGNVSDVLLKDKEKKKSLALAFMMNDCQPSFHWMTCHTSSWHSIQMLWKVRKVWNAYIWRH